jgi:hypothetical protein
MNRAQLELVVSENALGKLRNSARFLDPAG